MAEAGVLVLLVDDNQIFRIAEQASQQVPTSL
jgi:hypothetical protein